MLGGIIGWLFPDIATNDWIKALGDGFIKLIKMVIAPIIFVTVVSGIAHIQDAKKVGRVGIKALVYFEIVSTFALVIGLIIGNMFQVGHGLGGKANAAAVAKFASEAGHQKSVDFVLDIIPDCVIGAFAKGDILQVLLFSILLGFALMVMRRAQRTGVRDLIDDISQAVFGVIAIIMKARAHSAPSAPWPIRVGKFGPTALGNLAGLVATVLSHRGLFVFVVLGHCALCPASTSCAISPTSRTSS